eukprot:CAMPEP_0177653608 /NCGR_PEP_ID=MMETSP0447-20121125/13836_1 /TAXON_ID=0 /ORGANISM="Stygamoeba regulata, Strain BSH-02190019" /LENGTH=592 /DNA_ID=CAMNT_0019157095 /DNA_START=212 /DNA_END=1990 /DNA_ORIENTATION=+
MDLNNSFLEACRIGDENAGVEALISGANVETTDADGNTGLHLLLNLPPNKFSLVLAEAIIINFKAKPNVKNTSHLSTPLHFACRNKHREVVKLMMVNPKLDTNAKDVDGCTPLHEACICGDADLISDLLVKQADVRSLVLGWNCLHLASFFGHVPATVLLMDHGLSAKSTTGEGSTPLHLAAMRGKLGVCKALIQNLLSQKAKDSDIAAYVNSVDKDGMTPLHRATHRGQKDVVLWLVATMKAKVDIEDRDGCTPLHNACEVGSLTSVTHLLSHGAQVSKKDKDGWTPFHVACATGFEDVVQVLMTQTNPAVFLSKTRSDHSTGLHFAAARGHAEVCRVLLQHKQVTPAVQLSTKDKWGHTPVDIATSDVQEVLRAFEDKEPPRATDSPHISQKERSQTGGSSASKHEPSKRSSLTKEAPEAGKRTSLTVEDPRKSRFLSRAATESSKLSEKADKKGSNSLAGDLQTSDSTSSLSSNIPYSSSSEEQAPKMKTSSSDNRLNPKISTGSASGAQVSAQLSIPTNKIQAGSSPGTSRSNPGTPKGPHAGPHTDRPAATATKRAALANPMMGQRLVGMKLKKATIEGLDNKPTTP